MDGKCSLLMNNLLEIPNSKEKTRNLVNDICLVISGEEYFIVFANECLIVMIVYAFNFI